jgi:hypothetical protein
MRTRATTGEARGIKSTGVVREGIDVVVKVVEFFMLNAIAIARGKLRKVQHAIFARAKNSRVVVAIREGQGKRM